MCGFCGCAIVLTGRIYSHIVFVCNIGAGRPKQRAQTYTMSMSMVVVRLRDGTNECVAHYGSVYKCGTNVYWYDPRNKQTAASARHAIVIVCVSVQLIWVRFMAFNSAAQHRAVQRRWDEVKIKQRQRNGLDKRLRFVLWCGNNDVEMTRRGVFEFDAIKQHQ